MFFFILLLLTAALGGCLGAAMSHVPGKRGRTVLTGLLLVPVTVGLFVGGICLLARSTDLTAVCDRFFPERLSKLAGCGLLLLLFCVLGLLAGALRAHGLRRYLRMVQGSRTHRWTGRILLAGGLALILGCAVLAGVPTPTQVRLSEVCCANFTLLTDPDTGDYGDYIELINTGDQPAELGGCFLSDQAKKRNRFRLPALTLRPGECVVLWADGKGKTGAGSGTGIHLNFTIQPGDTVWFSSPHGILLDRVTVPERYQNISLSRLGNDWTLARGTPGRENEGAEIFTPPTLPAPTLSLAGGFYAEPQTLTITAAPGCEIRYTLDGSVPTVNSDAYTGPLPLRDICAEPNRVVSQKNTTLDRSGAITEPVDKGTVLRAVAFDETGARSEPVTAVYFIGDAFAKYEGRAVLSLVAAPLDLFGNYGICVTGQDYDKWEAAGKNGDAPYPYFYRRGRMLERNCRVDLWDGDHRNVLSQNCGIRLQGDHSRAKPVKRFALYARPIYSGSSLFQTRIFEGIRSHCFTTRDDFSDVMAQKLAEGLDLGGLDAIPAVLFLNGEYYTQTYLRDRYNRQFFVAHYGADPDDVILISNHKLDVGTQEDYADYLALMDLIETADCADPTVYAEVCAKMDVENYAAYVALNIYCNNTDWSIYKNYKLWRTRTPEGEGVLDGRWHWLVYDMDGCVWSASKYGAHKDEFDAFQVRQPYTEATFLDMPIFSSLLKNPDFRSLFVQTWLKLMNVTLTCDRALSILEAYGQTEDSFWLELFRDRPKHAAALLIRDLELAGEACTLSLTVSDPAGGEILLEGAAPPISDGAWTGTWITGCPVTLTAEPAEGWRFAGWAGDAEGTAQTITLTPGADVNVEAIFKRS